MTKPELVTLIMDNTDEYKKTHLMDKHKDELEQIASTFIQTATEDCGTPAAASEPEENCENAANGYSEFESAMADVAELVNGYSNEDWNFINLDGAILRAYDENKKIVKGRRIDKDEFRATVLEKAREQATADSITEDPAAIGELTVSIMRTLLENLVAFCPMNDNERKMLETIPLLADFENSDSQVNGKNFLQKVKELHNIEISTSRALMVSLKRKRFIDIGGGKKTFITLLERGIRHLRTTA